MRIFYAHLIITLNGFHECGRPKAEGRPRKITDFRRKGGTFLQEWPKSCPKVAISHFYQPAEENDAPVWFKKPGQSSGAGGQPCRGVVARKTPLVDGWRTRGSKNCKNPALFAKRCAQNGVPLLTEDRPLQRAPVLTQEVRIPLARG